MLKFYTKYFNTILVFSPTISSDEKWDWVKKQKFLAQNTAFNNWVEKRKVEHDNPVVQGVEDEEDEFEKYVDKDFTGLIPDNHFFDDYNEDRFISIMEQQKALIALLKKHKQPKFLANRVLIIFDDLVGSALFAGTRGSYFKGVNTRHRHYSTSFLMVSQGYKEVPKTIRTNWTGLIVFEIGNEKEVQVVYEEFSMGLPFRDWIDVYRHATKDEHSFLYINFQKPRHLRLMKNFTNYLYVDHNK